MKKLFILILFFAIAGCKPSMPDRKDYSEDMLPCYLSEVCIKMPAYAKDKGIDCNLMTQKCFRYTDYDRCRKEEKPSDCFEKMGIRI